MKIFLISIIRRIVFLAIIIATVLLTPGWVPFHDPALIVSTLTKAWSMGSTELLSGRAFVYALAAFLVIAALGLAIAYFVMNLLLVRHFVAGSRKLIDEATKGAKSPSERRRIFAQNFDGLRQKLQDQPIVGHAFTEFCQTLVGTDEKEIRSTVRPQAFFNAGLAREKLPGLKLMNSIPGYFVGIGLLLTFIGLVLALGKAGQAASAENSEAMQRAMTDLLNIATFKFATSIAGLGASIVLSFVFRIYAVSIEATFDRFCASLESGLLYTAPLSISAEMNATLKEQLSQLKNITQGDFFARMGEQIAPRMNEAIASAMAPVSAHIKEAVGDLKANSQAGMADLLQEFGRTIQGGAGTEMQALAGTLAQMEKTLASMQNGLRGSGEDFGRSMAEASDQLKTFIEDAGRSFGQSATESRDALAAVAETLKETLNRANGDIEAGLGVAAGKASGKLEEAMGVVMDKLGGQIGPILERFARLAQQMQAVETALGNQRLALEGTTSEARKTADIFTSTAQDIRVATAPLAQVGARFAVASETMSGNLDRSTESLRQMQSEVTALASAMQSTNGQTNAFWTEFKDKFDQVDTALGHAVGTLSKSTADQSQLLSAQVSAVDNALAAAIGKLNPLLSDLTEAAGDIADSFGKGRRQPAPNGRGDEAR